MNMTPSQLKNISDILTKSAQYIEELESKIENSNTTQIQHSKQAEQNLAKKPVLEKLASVGAFSSDELESFKNLDVKTLEKIASSAVKPWSIGGGTGPSVEGKLDPIQAFVFGRNN